MANVTDNKSFYDAVTCVLSCALQGDSEIQRLAEERIKALEMVDDYPFTLVEIIGSSEEALPEKHVASVFLKNYFYGIYVGSKQNELLQSPMSLYKLCGSLVDLLRMNFISIKTMIAETLSYIVYKGGWAMIDHRIYPMLKSDNEEHIHNITFFLNQCMSSDNPANIFKCSPEYFDMLLTTLQRKTLAETRCFTMQPLYYVISVCLDSEHQENALSRLSLEFHNCLSEPYSANCDFKLKSEIIQFIVKFEAVGATQHGHIITSTLPAIGQLMTTCRDQFKEIVKRVLPIPKNYSEEIDDETADFVDLITQMVHLIKSLVFSMYFELLLEDLDNLLHCLLIFMCCFDDMEEDLFLDNELKSQIYPLRTIAADVLKNMEYRVTRRRKGAEIFYKSIHTVYNSMMEEAQMVRNNEGTMLYQVRILESLMYGLGYISRKNILQDLPEGMVLPHSFYLDQFTAQVQTSMRSSALVVGRLVWLGGVLSHLLNSNLLSIHLKAIIQNLSGQSTYLHVPSTEALRNHTITYDKNLMPEENVYILKSLSSELFECLLTMIQKINDPTACLKALGIFVKHHETCVFTYIQNTQAIIVNTIHTHLSNNNVMHEVNFVLGNMASKVILQESLHSITVPFLCKLVHGGICYELMDPKEATEKALECLSTIASHTAPPLNMALIAPGFCGAARLMLDQDYNGDASINEAAANFISTLLVKIKTQVGYLRDSKEVPLAEYIPKIIFICVDNVIPLASFQLARLCISSINTLPTVMEPHFESILKSVLSAIQTNRPFDKLRGLWIMFLYILMCRPKNTCNFLSSIPGPDGGSALNYLISIWQPEFVGSMTKFERSVLCLALVEVINAVLDGEEDKLKEVEIKLFTKERGSSTLNGVEYLYMLLIFAVLMEQALNETIPLPFLDFVLGGKDEDDEEEPEDEDILLKFSPLDINTVELVSRFLKHENVYYSNVCRKYLYEEELMRLSKMGCIVPQVSME